MGHVTHLVTAFCPISYWSFSFGSCVQTWLIWIDWILLFFLTHWFSVNVSRTAYKQTKKTHKLWYICFQWVTKPSFNFLCLHRNFQSSSSNMWRKTSLRISSSLMSGPWFSTRESAFTGVHMALSSSAWIPAETPVFGFPSLLKQKRLTTCVCVGWVCAHYPFIVCARCFESASALYRTMVFFFFFSWIKGFLFLLSHDCLLWHCGAPFVVVNRVFTSRPKVILFNVWAASTAQWVLCHSEFEELRTVAMDNPTILLLMKERSN